MPEWISNPPWTVLGGLAVAGVLLLFYAVTQALKKLLKVGLLLLAAAVVWFVVGRLVESGPERAVRDTKQIITAADRRDWTTFKSLLDPKVKFAFFGDRDTLAKGVKATMERQDVKNVTATDFDVKEEPGGYTVTFAAYADIGAISQRAPTNWKFFWAKTADGKGELLYRIEVLRVGQFDADTVTSRLVR